jgi:hypothetical protein
MSELARSIASRLRQFIGDRRHAERVRVNLPVEVSLVPESRHDPLRRPQSIGGHTLDLSSTGLAVIVPQIRLADHYLAGETRSLLLKLESPVGRLEIQATPVRYERLEEEDSEHGYVIGVTITSMSEDDRGRYNEYVSSLLLK